MQTTRTATRLGVLALAVWAVAAFTPSAVLNAAPSIVSPVRDSMADYQVSQCDASKGTGLDGWRAGSDGWAAQNLCAGAFNVTGLVNGVYTAAGTVAYWRTPNLPGNLSFQSATYEGLGSLQSAFIGTARFCMNDVDPWCTSGGSSWVINNAGWIGRSDIAPGAREFQLLMSCFGASPCPRTTWSNIWLRNVNFTMHDADAPTAATWGGTLTYTPDYSNPATWNSGSRTLVIHGTDGTSGIEHDNIAFDHDVNHPLKQTQSASCNRVSGGYGSFIPCWTVWDFTHTIDTTQFTDGSHAVHAWTWDTSGNPAQVNATFKVDNADPAEPDTLDLAADNAQGWQTVNDFDLSWGNSGEVAETTTQSGIARSCYDVNPGEGQATDPAQVCVNDAINSLADVQVPDDGRWEIQVWTEDRAGNASGRAQEMLRLDTTEPGRPTGQANGWVGLEELMAGKPQAWSKPINWKSVNSGFCGYGFSVTPNQYDEAPATINVVGDVTQAPIPAATPEGINWAHFRPISCAGLVGPTESVDVKVDLTNPQATVAGIPRSGWTNNPGTVNVSGVDAMPGSGMAGSVPPAMVTEGAFVRFVLDGATAKEDRGGVGSFDASTLPEGSHTLTIRTFDVALNYDEQTFSYGVDKTPPSGAFAGSDPSDPTVFKVGVTDALSGVSGGIVQYAPLGDSGYPAAFKNLATTYENGQLAASFPDTKLPHGQYALRAIVEDAATNSGYVTKNVRGVRMVIENPLRERTGLTLSATKNGKPCKRAKAKSKAGKRKAAKKYRICKKKLAKGKGTDVSVSVRYGRALMLYGRLTDRDGNPIASQRVELLQQRAGDNLRDVGSATTDANGQFAYKAPGGPSRRVIAYWAGSKTHQDVSASVRLGVATKVSLRVAPRSVRGARPFTLKGKVFSQDGVSASGKLVQLQFFNYLRKKWQAGPALVRAGKDGKFKYTYRIKRASAAKEKIMFRAYVPSESSWAYDAGTSRTQTIIHRK